MKKLLVLILLLISVKSFAQIPYYAGSQGKGNTYTYLSTKFHPTHNEQTAYIAAQYGLFDKLDLATDLTSGNGYSFQGFGTRFNVLNSAFFSLGGQVMAAFDINDSYKFNYNTNSLYMNGEIYRGLHWVSNTWWTIYDGSRNTLQQWTYLGYTYNWITPMIGLDTYLRDSHGCDLLAGVYCSINKVNIYLWGSNLTKNFSNRRLVIGIDYKF